VGVARSPFFEGLDADVATAVEAAIGVVGTLTASVVDVAVPAPGNVAEVWNPEIYAYHLRSTSRAADDDRSVWILLLGAADRAADQREPLRRVHGSVACARVRAGDRVARAASFSGVRCSSGGGFMVGRSGIEEPTASLSL
jgi:hypothetical protein